MKLLLYGDYYQKPTGFAREVRDLIPELKKAGYEIRQVALGFNGMPKDPEIEIYPGNFHKLDSYWAREMLEYAIQDFEPDVVLTLGDYYMLPKIAFAMAYPRKLKWIHWGVLDGAPLGFGCKEPLKWVDYNLYHSNFAKEEIEKVLPDIKGEVFFPATDPKTFFKMNKEQLKKDFDCEGKFIITTVARNQTRKNLPALIEAMGYIREQIPEAMLLLGVTHNTKTPEGDLEGHELQYLIDYYGVNDCVVLPKEKNGDGSLSDKTIREIYDLGDIFCLPTMGEGFGMIFHESMACGVPVLATDCSAVPDTLNNCGYLIPPIGSFHHAEGVSHSIVSPATIFSLILDIYGDRKKLKEKAELGEKFVREFTPEKQANKLDAIIKKVLINDYKSLMRQSV
ncbi:MAG: glycosyltransferase family 4 protein [Candidatus Omnitrophica bacterium]|nr:glycosyltransferase family 4 protein [Candidatus Omnitrophota bacterium]